MVVGYLVIKLRESVNERSVDALNQIGCGACRTATSLKAATTIIRLPGHSWQTNKAAAARMSEIERDHQFYMTLVTIQATTSALVHRIVG